jgi:hypothetical protein
MDCEEVKINLPEYIDGKLDKATSETVEKHLESCVLCRNFHQEMSSFLTFMDSVPDPEVPEGMKEEFIRTVENMKTKKGRVIPVWFRIAAMILLAFGTYWLGYKTGTHQGEIAQNELATELSTQKQQVLLASLRDYTSPQKIEAVYSIGNTRNVNSELINVLVYTMNSDRNTNVRLAAITALSGMMDKNERIKNELIKSLTIQENPLLQISLIQVLTEKGVKEAKNQIETISNSEKTDENVKAFARDRIKAVI